MTDDIMKIILVETNRNRKTEKPLICHKICLQSYGYIALLVYAERSVH